MEVNALIKFKNVKTVLSQEFSARPAGLYSLSVTVNMEKRRPRKEGYPPSQVNFSKRLLYMRKKLDPPSQGPSQQHSGMFLIWSRAIHPRKFGNHVTVRRPPDRPQQGIPMFNLELSS